MNEEHMALFTLSLSLFFFFFKVTVIIKDRLFVHHLVYSSIVLSLKYKITNKGDICVYT